MQGVRCMDPAGKDKADPPCGGGKRLWAQKQAWLDGNYHDPFRMSSQTNPKLRAQLVPQLKHLNASWAVFSVIPASPSSISQ